MGTGAKVREGIETEASPRSARGSRWFDLLYVAFAAMLALPIVLPKYPPLVDYPNNLTRADILSRYAEVEQFRNTYTIQRVPIANLAMDLTVPLLARAIGIFPAGKLFLVFVLALYAAGCYLLCVEAQGSNSWVAPIILSFFYNTAVTSGFMNYVAGVAAWLITFACWLRWSRAWTARRVISFVLLALCCYLAHLSSIVMLGISVAAVSVWESRRGRLPAAAILLSGIAFIVPAGLFLNFMRGPGRVGAVGWNTLAGKIVDLPLVVRTYSLPFDLIWLATAVVGALLWVRASRGVTVNRPTLVAALTLLVCFIVSPKDLFTSNAVDLRFVWPASVLLAAAIRPRIPSRSGHALLAALVLLCSVRAAVMWYAWNDLGSRVAEIVRTFDFVARGATLYPAFFAAEDYDEAKRDMALRHVACYAVITRDAYVPTVFAMPAQQPMVQKAGLRYIDWTPGHDEVWHGYDYVWTYKPPLKLLTQLTRDATLVARAADTSLWRVDRR